MPDETSADKLAASVVSLLFVTQDAKRTFSIRFPNKTVKQPDTSTVFS